MLANFGNLEVIAIGVGVLVTYLAARFNII